MKSTRKKKQRGIALVMVLFALMLLSAVGLAMMYATNTETAINANFKDKQVALYASMAGLQEARDRIQPVNVVAPILAPTGLPQNGAPNVIYIINPRNGETVAPWNTSNAYFDTEFCHENVISMTGTVGTPCTTIASGASWYSTVNDSQSANAPWNIASPLAMKWTRITLKGNNMSSVPVNGNATDASVVCWTGSSQVIVPGAAGTALEHYSPLTCGPTHHVASIILTNAGTGYTTAPVVQITGGGGTGATAVANFDPVPSGTVAEINITNGGSGYTSNPTVTLTGGGGSGATATASIYNPGAPVASLSLTNAGSQCYATAPSVAISGGGGSGATGTAVLAGSYSCIYSLVVSANCAKSDTVNFTVSGGGGSSFSAGSYTTSSTNGNFTGLPLSIVNPGNNYNGSAITVSVTGTKPQSSPCTNVAATATFGYRPASLTLNAGGASYQTAPTVTLGGGVGSGVTAPSATATLGTPPANAQTVTSITVTAAGGGYSTPPTVSITGGGGTGATATATIGSIYKITGVTVTDGGSGYTSIPTVSFTGGGGGSGATARATVDGVAGLTYGQIWLLTSLAQTSSGARAMTQMEVATPVRGISSAAALTLDGPNPNIDQLPNSTPFYIDGRDYVTSTPPATGSAVPQPQGCDATPEAAHPAVGAYDDPNASPATNSIQNVVDAIPAGRTNNYQGSGPSPDVENIYGALGDTMSTPSGMKAFMDAVYAQASTNGTAYSSNPGSVNYGTQNNPIIDYVNGDLTLGGTGTGYGMLLVTGTLTMSGNFSWNGLILALGDGAVQFQGGGNGQINGSIIIAKIWDSYTTQNLLNSMGSPYMHWNGGGGNGVYYNHCWVNTMLGSVPFFPPPPSRQLKVLSTRTLSY